MAKQPTLRQMIRAGVNRKAAPKKHPIKDAIRRAKPAVPNYGRK